MGYLMCALILCIRDLQEQPDAYDKLIKELPMERRARPSDRKKTAEEIAQDERERLESLEVLLKPNQKFISDNVSSKLMMCVL